MFARFATHTAGPGARPDRRTAGGVSQVSYRGREGEQEEVRQEDGQVLPGARKVPQHVLQEAGDCRRRGKRNDFIPI